MSALWTPGLLLHVIYDDKTLKHISSPTIACFVLTSVWLQFVQGGVVMKKREWQQADRPWLLAVEDPQQLGKDIGAGTYNIRNVQHLFAAAAATLRDCMEQETEEERWAAVQVGFT